MADTERGLTLRSTRPPAGVGGHPGCRCGFRVLGHFVRSVGSASSKPWAMVRRLRRRPCEVSQSRAQSRHVVPDVRSHVGVIPRPEVGGCVGVEVGPQARSKQPFAAAWVLRCGLPVVRQFGRAGVRRGERTRGWTCRRRAIRVAPTASRFVASRSNERTTTAYVSRDIDR
jgi:hypothetical protein